MICTNRNVEIGKNAMYLLDEEWSEVDIMKIINTI